MTQEAVISHKQNITGPVDLLLTAKAKSKKLIPVTSNIKDFERVERLKIENRVKELQKQ